MEQCWPSWADIAIGAELSTRVPAGHASLLHSSSNKSAAATSAGAVPTSAYHRAELTDFSGGWGPWALMRLILAATAFRKLV